jgi:hypothetical protein
MNEDHLKSERPDFVIIFPWNLTEEIVKQLSYIKSWDAQFLTAIPEIKLI